MHEHAQIYLGCNIDPLFVGNSDLNPQKPQKRNWEQWLVGAETSSTSSLRFVKQETVVNTHTQLARNWAFIPHCNILNFPSLDYFRILLGIQLGNVFHDLFTIVFPFPCEKDSSQKSIQHYFDNSVSNPSRQLILVNARMSTEVSVTESLTYMWMHSCSCALFAQFISRAPFF